MMSVVRAAGRGLRSLLVGIGALVFSAGAVVVLANYNATVPGSGTSFASVLISSVNYAAMLICDSQIGQGTTGGNCASVKAASVAPLTTDPALVVALSPNSGLISPGQAVMAASMPVAIASDQSAVPTKLNTTPSLANGSGMVPTQGGTVLSATNGGYTNLLLGNAVPSSGNPLPVTLPAGDPCASGTKVYTPISQTANAQLVALTSGKIIYVCNAFYNGSDAENISLVEGTGSVCAGATAAVIGAATAAAGNNFAANSGMAIGNGASSVAATATVSHALCLFQSGTGRVAGVIVTVTQ